MLFPFFLLALKNPKQKMRHTMYRAEKSWKKICAMFTRCTRRRAMPQRFLV